MNLDFYFWLEFSQLILIFIVWRLSQQVNHRWFIFLLFCLWLLQNLFWNPLQQLIQMTTPWLDNFIQFLFYLLSYQLLVYRYHISGYIARYSQRYLLSRYSKVQTVLPYPYQQQLLSSEIKLTSLFKWAMLVSVVSWLQLPIDLAYQNPQADYLWFSNINTWLFNNNQQALAELEQIAEKIILLVEQLIILSFTLGLLWRRLFNRE